MTPYVERIAGRLRTAEHDLARDLKQGVLAYIREGNLFSLLTAPVIYSLLLPLAVLDAWVTIYQWVCFPIYGIVRVRRGRYFVIDRHRLAYLNAIEKVHCTFCSYANGVIAYVREVAARTEQYWCPIKHARPVPTPHRRYALFFDYGNATRYRRELAALRRTLRRERHSRRGSQGSRANARVRIIASTSSGCTKARSPVANS